MGNATASNLDTVINEQLYFHQVHAANIELSRNDRRARRIDGHRGLCFSSRPVAVGERLSFKVLATSQGHRHKGIGLRFGFTAIDPSCDNTMFPAGHVKYGEISTSEHGYWVKAVSEAVTKCGSVLGFCVGIGGEVIYGVGDEVLGVLFAGVCTNIPLWVVIDLCGSASAVEFVELAVSCKSIASGMTKAVLAKYEARRSTRHIIPSTETSHSLTTEAFSSVQELAPTFQGINISEQLCSDSVISSNTKCRMSTTSTKHIGYQHNNGTITDTGASEILQSDGKCKLTTLNNSPNINFKQSDSGYNLVDPIETGFLQSLATSPCNSTNSKHMNSRHQSAAAALLHSSHKGSLSHPTSGRQSSCASQHLTDVFHDQYCSAIAAASTSAFSSCDQHSGLSIPKTAGDTLPCVPNESSSVVSQLKTMSSGFRQYRAINVNKVMPFHRTHGRNVSLSANFHSATRHPGDFCNAYVFTQQPLWPGQELIVRITDINRDYAGGLTVGLTACDPINLTASELPDNADALLDRPEYWVVHKGICSRPKLDDELAFHRTISGEFIYYRNGREAGTLMHVDCTLPLWAFFDVYGTAQKMEIIGIVRRSDRTEQSTSLHQGLLSELSSHGRQDTTVSRSRSANVQQRTANIVSFSDISTKPADSLHVSADGLQKTPLVISSNSSINDLLFDASSLSLPPPLIPVPHIQSSLPSLETVVSSSHHGQLVDGSCETLEFSNGNASGVSDVHQPHVYQSSDIAHKLLTDEALLIVYADGRLTSEIEKKPGQQARSSNGECAICMECESDCALYACGHMCLCHKCAVNVQKQRSALCPICRQPIVDVLRIYRT